MEIQEKTKRLRVLLLGDSINMGRAPHVRNLLQTRAEILYNKENCRNSANLLVVLNDLLRENAPLDAVQINCGQWDSAHFGGDLFPLTSLSEYEKNMSMLFERLRRKLPSAKLFAATTTPMNPVSCETDNPRTTDEIRLYNDVLCRVCERYAVTVNDLFSEVITYDESLFADYCHLTEEGFLRLAKYEAEFLVRELSL